MLWFSDWTASCQLISLHRRWNKDKTIILGTIGKAIGVLQANIISPHTELLTLECADYLSNGENPSYTYKQKGTISWKQLCNLVHFYLELLKYAKITYQM